MRPPEADPAWAHERVRVLPADPGLFDRAAGFARELHAVLGDRLTGPVEHVGSTAVPGLAAKPVVDLQAATADPAAVVAERHDALVAARWHPVPPELDRRPWRALLVRVDPAGRHRLAHLHLMPTGEPRLAEQRRFRDRLRAAPHLAEQYARIKQEAALRHGDDREAYTRAKTEFVRRVLDR